VVDTFTYTPGQACRMAEILDRRIEHYTSSLVFPLMQAFRPGARTMRPRLLLKETMATAHSKPAPKRRLRLRFQGESRTYDQASSLARTTRRTGSRIGRAGSHRGRGARARAPGASNPVH